MSMSFKERGIGGIQREKSNRKDEYIEKRRMGGI
jgi:hypothetical protein